MQRHKFVSSKREPVMTWGSKGDTITNKETGETYTLHSRHEDGWVVTKDSFNGVLGGGMYKFSWTELGKDFTDPEVEKERAMNLEKEIDIKMKSLGSRRINMMDLI